MGAAAALLLALALGAGRFDVEAVGRALARDATSLAAPGVPGSVCALVERSGVVVADEQGVPVVAAAAPRDGRVVAFGHTGYLDPATLADPDTARVLENALRWAGGRDAPRVAAPRRAELARWLEARGARVVPLDELAPRDLRGVDVLVLDGHRERDEAELDDLRAWVRRGGGLVIAATGWGWQQLHPGEAPGAMPGNRLLAPLGLAFGLESARGVDGRLALDAPEPRSAAGRAWSDLCEERAEGEAARRAAARVLAALEVLPPDEPSFAAPVRAELERRARGFLAELDGGRALGAEPFARLLVHHLERAWRAARPEDVPACPTAARFPGALPAGAERARARVALEPTTRGWHALGLWAPAGEVVSARVVEGTAPARAALRVGCHTDRLWHLERWERWPEIALSAPLEDGAVRVASAHGGLLYLDLPRAPEGPVELVLEVEGAARAPRFALGRDDPARWRETLERAPAPWGEIEGARVALALPRAALERVEDPAAVARFWDAVCEAHAELLGEPISDRPERIVADLQISAGYMHSGYPIMTHLDGADAAVDLERLRREGSWGHFHELGHNAQRPEWTFAGTTEVTCNLFTLHAMEAVVGIPVAEHPRGLALVAEAAPYLAEGADFARWKREPFVALASYVELQQAFGWELFRGLFREYARLPAAERPRGDAAERDQFCVRASRRAGRDLSPFFARWGVPIGAGAAASLADLEPWSGPEAGARSAGESAGDRPSTSGGKR